MAEHNKPNEWPYHTDGEDGEKCEDETWCVDSIEASNCRILSKRPRASKSLGAAARKHVHCSLDHGDVRHTGRQADEPAENWSDELTEDSSTHRHCPVHMLRGSLVTRPTKDELLDSDPANCERKVKGSPKEAKNENGILAAETNFDVHNAVGMNEWCFEAKGTEEDVHRFECRGSVSFHRGADACNELEGRDEGDDELIGMGRRRGKKVRGLVGKNL